MDKSSLAQDDSLAENAREPRQILSTREPAPSLLNATPPSNRTHTRFGADTIPFSG